MVAFGMDIRVPEEKGNLSKTVLIGMRKSKKIKNEIGKI